MGIVVAQDIFQSKLDAIFIGMEGVTGIADNMVTLRWCCLDKICSPASFLGLTYLVEVSYFVAFLALCILGCTLLSWLVLQFSTSHTLPFHSWGFSRWLTVIWRSLCSRIILSLVLSTSSF